MDLSVVIPYYNLPVEYLQRCLNSIIPQLSDNSIEWEVLVIDDGSDNPLGTASISHPKVSYKRLEHGGPGRARNEGIRLAQGEYILFVDADDYLFPNTLAPLLTHLFDIKPDLLRFQMKKVNDFVPASANNRQVLFTEPISGEDYMLHNNLPDLVWAYFFKRILAKEHILIFSEKEYLEDSMFTCKLHHAAQRVITTNAVVYAYNQRDGSIMNTHTPQRRQELRKLHSKNLLLMADFIKKEESKGNVMGLRRKLTFYTIDYLNRVSHDLTWQEIHQNEIPWLRSHYLYPLPNRPYGWKYFFFRVLANHSFGLRLIRVLFWQ